MARVHSSTDKNVPLSGSVEAAGLAALLSLDGHAPQQDRSAPALSAPEHDLQSGAGAQGADHAAAASPLAAPAHVPGPMPDPVRPVLPRARPQPAVIPQSPTPGPADAAPLGNIGPHRLTAAIRHDGLGRLFKAWDSQAGMEVALTVLDLEPDAKGRDGILSQLQQGVLAAAPLQHPGLARILDAGVIGEGVYIATEWLPGRSLAQTLRSGWQPAPEVAATVLASLCEALTHAHAHGVVHGGLNPATVMLDADDNPKITGLGYAGAAYASDLPSMDPLVTGAAPYLAPEQLQGGAVDARTDIHALGVLLYEMLVGRRAYPGDTVPVIAQALLHHDPAPPHWLSKDVPERLSAIAMQALQRNPAARYASVADMAASLKLWLREVDKESHLARRAFVRAQAKPRRTLRKKHWAGVGMLLAATAAVAFTWVERGEPPAASPSGSPAVLASPAPAPATAAVDAERPVVTAPSVVEASAEQASLPAETPPTPPGVASTLEQPQADLVRAAPVASGALSAPSTLDAWAHGQPPVAGLKSSEAAVEPVPSAPVVTPRADTSARAAAPVQRPPARVVAARSPATPAAPVAAPAMGTVSLAVTPWGYVEVGGRAAGATPPLNALTLPVGTHTVTIRNQDFPPFVTTVRVTANQVATVRHRFER